MKQAFLFLTAALCLNAGKINAQLYIGSGAPVSIKGGTTFSTDSLILAPASDLTLSNINILPTYTAVSGVGGTSILRVYLISAPLTMDGTIGLSYADAELNGNTASALEVVYQQPGGTWVTTSGSASDVGARRVSNGFGTAITLSKVTATSSSLPLPITLLRFAARAEDNRSRLDWQVANAATTRSYDIERAADGVHFSRIASTPAVAGQSEYVYYDEQPLDGTNYYRLAANDADGSVSLSAVRTTWFGSKGASDISVYPLPAQAVLNLSMSNDPPPVAGILLTNAAGQVLYRAACTARETRIDVSAYPDGIYLLTYSHGNESRHFKVEKTN